MIIAPLGFERLPPLYNPSIVSEMASVEPQSAPQTVAALEAINSSSLKTALDRSALQSPHTNKKESAHNAPMALPVVVLDLVAGSASPTEYASLITEMQPLRVPTNVAIAAYEDAGQSQKIPGSSIVA